MLECLSIARCLMWAGFKLLLAEDQGFALLLTRSCYKLDSAEGSLPSSRFEVNNAKSFPVKFSGTITFDATSKGDAKATLYFDAPSKRVGSHFENAAATRESNAALLELRVLRFSCDFASVRGLLCYNRVTMCFYRDEFKIITKSIGISALSISNCIVLIKRAEGQKVSASVCRRDLHQQRKYFLQAPVRTQSACIRQIRAPRKREPLNK